MRVICPTCGELIPGKDFDLRRSVAACRPCGEVVALPALARDGEANAALVAREVANLPLHGYRPADMDLVEERQGLRFHFQLTPDRFTAVLVVLFAVVWNSFLLFWLSFALNGGRSTFGLLAFWFPVLHLGAGVALLHTAVCMLVNHTVIDLNPLRLTFAHKPLWQPGVFSRPTRLLRAVVDVEQVAKGSRDRWFRPSITYSVAVLMRDGSSAPLRLHLDRNHARYLAQRLNRALDEIRAAEPDPTRAEPADPAEAAGPYRDAATP